MLALQNCSHDLLLVNQNETVYGCCIYSSHAGCLVDDLMGNLVADSVGRAYSGKLNRQRWGPIKQMVPQCRRRAAKGRTRTTWSLRMVQITARRMARTMSSSRVSGAPRKQWKQGCQ